MSSLKVLIKNTMRSISNRRYSVNITKKQKLWTPGNTVVSPYKDMEIPNISTTDYIWRHLDKWADKPAVVCGLTNRSYTYHQLYKNSRNFAAKLRSQFKLRNGDIVYIIMTNSIEYPVAVLGALEAGAQVTTVNPSYTIHEVLRTLKSSYPKIIIGTAEIVVTITKALKLSNRDVPIITVENIRGEIPSGTISFKELIEDVHVDHNVLRGVRNSTEDVAFLPFSSGTTGMPKEVELLNRNIVVTCLNQDIEGTRQYNETTNSNQDSVLAVLPFYHIYGLSIIMLHKLSIGAKLVTLPKFQPNTFLTTMKQHRISLLYVVPPILLFLGSNSDVKKENLDSVQNLVWGAAPASQNDIRKCLQKCRAHIKVTQLYGSTETTLITVSEPGSDKCGYAVRNTEMKIVGENGIHLGPNGVGELLVRGPQVMKSYKNNPEATKNAFTEGNWFKTGDLGSIDKHGALSIVDRIKELIKVKGYQVPPVELEKVLKEHPAIIDAAVVGVPDNALGEVPRAFVVLKDGCDLKVNNIMKFIEERVAEYKRVKDIVVLNDLPKSPSGKILRKVLKAKYC